MASKIEPFISAAAGLAGVVVGGIISSYSASRLAETTALRTMQSTAYTDFVNAQAGYMTTNSADAGHRIRQASIRIAVTAPSPVVVNVANFIREAAPRTPCVKAEGDLAMYRSIRSDLLEESENELSNADLAMVLFGCAY